MKFMFQIHESTHKAILKILFVSHTNPSYVSLIWQQQVSLKEKLLLLHFLTDLPMPCDLIEEETRMN